MSMRSLPPSFRPSPVVGVATRSEDSRGNRPSPVFETENEEHFSLGYTDDEESVGGGGRSRSGSLLAGGGGRGGRDDSGFADVDEGEGGEEAYGGGREERDPLGVRREKG